MSTDVQNARLLVDSAQRVVDAALAHAAATTEGGAKIDDHQVHTERVTYLATQVRAARELTSAAERLEAAGKADSLMAAEAFVYAAEATHALGSAIDAAWEDFGVGEAVAAIQAQAVRDAMRAGLSEARIREIGRARIASGASTTSSCRTRWRA